MAPGLTPEQAVEKGKKAALDSLANLATPILFMDEWCDTETDTAYAMGWIPSVSVRRIKLALRH
jgi:hypothetical protein